MQLCASWIYTFFMKNFRKTNGETGASDGNAVDLNRWIGKTARRVQQGSPEKVYQKKEAKAVIDSVIADTLVFENGNLFGNIKGKSRRACKISGEIITTE